MSGMEIFWMVFGIVVGVILLLLLLTFICFYKVFYAPRKKHLNKEEFKLPNGAIYEKYRDVMVEWIKEMRARPHEDVKITSFDGLILRGKYYECVPGAPIEVMFHGYRGSAESDLCGGVKRCFDLGHNALVVDNRTAGRSEGNVITFGVNESRDCHSWIEFVCHKFGEDVKIILTGISMGAATVLMAAGKPLPKTVVGVLADCGYTSPKEIIKKVICEMKLPVGLVYPFVKLGAKWYGHFNLEADSPIEAMARCQVPVLLIHGEEDAFVPCEMSQKNYAACVSPKRLVTIPGAGHGLAYMIDSERYVKELRDFFDPLLNTKA